VGDLYYFFVDERAHVMPCPWFACSYSSLLHRSTIISLLSPEAFEPGRLSSLIPVQTTVRKNRRIFWFAPERSRAHLEASPFVI